MSRKQVVEDARDVARRVQGGGSHQGAAACSSKADHRTRSIYACSSLHRNRVHGQKSCRYMLGLRGFRWTFVLYYSHLSIPVPIAPIDMRQFPVTDLLLPLWICCPGESFDYVPVRPLNCISECRIEGQTVLQLKLSRFCQILGAFKRT